MSIVIIQGKRVVFEPCKKHAHYEGSAFVVLSCKRCVVRLATEEDES